MPKVLEFRNVDELNNFLDKNLMVSRWEVIPISRMFENPTTKLLTSCMTYVLVMN